MVSEAFSWKTLRAEVDFERLTVSPIMDDGLVARGVWKVGSAKHLSPSEGSLVTFVLYGCSAAPAESPVVMPLSLGNRVFRLSVQHQSTLSFAPVA